jgi:hypothetical protein
VASNASAGGNGLAVFITKAGAGTVGKRLLFSEEKEAKRL